MVKSGLGLFAGRRKSQSNVLEDVVEPAPPVSKPSPPADSGSGGGFRVMTATEADARKKEEKRRASEKAASKFRPFSGFGNNGNKGRNSSFDDISPGSSKRDSKSSSGTGGSRPYNNGQFGSTSTLPSSADTHSDDNIFAVPRPHVSHQQSAPGALYMKKQLPAVPKADSRYYNSSDQQDSAYGGRVRAMTSSSYASTAKPPTLDADLNFGSSGFDDMFSGIERKESPEMTNDPTGGRSLLQGKRHFQAEPLNIDRRLDVEPPLTSWDSRGSADNLMSTESLDRDDSPPPPPPHKFSHSHQQQYAPVASHSPDLNGSNGFAHSNPQPIRHPVMASKPLPQSSSPEPIPQTVSSSSASSLQTPLSSHSGDSHTTPKAAVHPSYREHHADDDNDDDEDLFTPSKPKEQKPSAPAVKDTRPPLPAVDESGRRIMTQAEFRAQQQRATQQPPQDDSEEEDYEDEEDAEERAAQEAIARRKKQQMDLARDSMRRSTTAPTGASNRPDSVAESINMGFPSEVSLKADEWEDEDIPLGILAQHGFPSTARNRAPAQPPNAIPSYYRDSSASLGLPERPASAGPMGNRASAFRPAFARNLPEDPHATFVGSGLIHQSNRESMGFNRGPGSVVGDPMMGYQEPQLSAPSLVEQIHMRDMSKPKYMGGGSSKQKPQGGPFTGAMGAQMNSSMQNAGSTRMSVMNPGMNGMNGMGMGMGMGMGQNGMNQMNSMMGMGMGMMGAPNGMPMMGMNGMAYPTTQQEYMQQMQHMQQMQQMLAAQQMQMQQMAMGQQQQPSFDPRMSMAMPNGFPGGNNFLNPNGPLGQRPMSIMSNNMGQQTQPFAPQPQQQQPPPRPYSSGANLMGNMSPFPPPSLGPMPGYTPSIAPSERSNIGLSARYRPVATNNDAKSTVSSSMTLQASGGAAQNSNLGPPGVVKGILKKGQAQKQQTLQEEEDEDGWGKMAARKSKFGFGGAKSGSSKQPQQTKSNNDDDLRDIVKGLEGL
ncbi:unnamed protein product [Periconia digitata]|uniref:Uncharacterized protein n=1 Tax=Periconia digitata TaxID=1303443 RepID=A0A9W4UTD4_9PLEO|nr:unnamed protein product [Periconia digitata]